jgi:hypothetical protein
MIGWQIDAELQGKLGCSGVLPDAERGQCRQAGGSL